MTNIINTIYVYLNILNELISSIHNYTYLIKTDLILSYQFTPIKFTITYLSKRIIRIQPIQIRNTFILNLNQFHSWVVWCQKIA